MKSFIIVLGVLFQLDGVYSEAKKFLWKLQLFCNVENMNDNKKICRIIHSQGLLKHIKRTLIFGQHQHQMCNKMYTTAMKKIKYEN